jgi:phosphorylcholine metabolism protein LicD
MKKTEKLILKIIKDPNYKYHRLSTVRIIFYKFIKIVDENWTIKRKNRNLSDNRVQNLYCPKLDQENELISNKKTC